MLMKIIIPIFMCTWPFSFPLPFPHFLPFFRFWIKEILMNVGKWNYLQFDYVFVLSFVLFMLAAVVNKITIVLSFQGTHTHAHSGRENETTNKKQNCWCRERQKKIGTTIHKLNELWATQPRIDLATLSLCMAQHNNLIWMCLLSIKKNLEESRQPRKESKINETLLLCGCCFFAYIELITML